MTVAEWAHIGASFGLDGIDASILFVPDQSPDAVAALRREIESSPDTEQHARELQLEIQAVRVSGALGARYVRVTAGQAHP